MLQITELKKEQKTRFTSFKLNNLTNSDKDIAREYLRQIKDEGFNPYSIGVLPLEKTIDSELAAYKAVHAQFGFEGSIQNQVRSIYKLMRIRIRESMSYFAQSYRTPRLYDAARTISGEVIMNQLLRVLKCRPSGGRFSLDFEDKNKRCDLVCNLYKICPWCFYRKFCELYDDLIELDATVAPNSMWTISEAFLKGGRPVHLSINKRLRDWLNKTAGVPKYSFMLRASGTSLLQTTYKDGIKEDNQSTHIVLIAPGRTRIWDWSLMHRTQMYQDSSRGNCTNTMGFILNNVLPLAYKFPTEIYAINKPGLIGDYIAQTYDTKATTVKGLVK